MAYQTRETNVNKYAAQYFAKPGKIEVKAGSMVIVLPPETMKTGYPTKSGGQNLNVFRSGDVKGAKFGGFLPLRGNDAFAWTLALTRRKDAKPAEAKNVGPSDLLEMLQAMGIKPTAAQLKAAQAAQAQAQDSEPAAEEETDEIPF